MDKTTQSTMFSSKTVEWETPATFFQRLSKFYDFTLDPCATDASAKCQKYFTKTDDGLTKDWAGNIVFMNPPYGRVIKNWVRKAWEEGTKPNTTVVCLPTCCFHLCYSLLHMSDHATRCHKLFTSA